MHLANSIRPIPDHRVPEPDFPRESLPAAILLPSPAFPCRRRPVIIGLWRKGAGNMKMVRTIGRALARAMLAGWIFPDMVAMAMAQMPGPKEEEKSDPSRDWALVYALVLLTVLLGLLVVLRVSNRRDREKPEEYESNPELKMEE